MERGEPYKVPEGYFEQLNARILQQTVERDGADGKVVDFSKVAPAKRTYNYRGLASFAACFAALVAIAWGGFYLIAGDAMQHSADDLDAFYSEQIYGISDEVFYEEILNEDDEYFADAALEYLDNYSISTAELIYE